MEVHFTPEQEARIAQVAATTGTDPEALVKDATMRLLDEDTRFRAAVMPMPTGANLSRKTRWTPVSKK
jgi:hypothetical protein